jgi:hypothetical protein
MAKSNVIVFDGEHNFISNKKHIYNKNKGKSMYVGATGEVISTSTTTQDTIKPLPIATPTYTSAVPSAQTSESVSPPSTTRTTSKVLPTINVIQSGSQGDLSNPVLEFDDKLTGRGLLSDAQGNKTVIPIGNPVISNPEYGSNPDEGAPNPTPYPFCPSGYKYDISFGRCVKDTSLNPDVVCEPGYIKDVNGVCVEKPKISRDTCPEGYTKDANDKCVENTTSTTTTTTTLANNGGGDTTIIPGLGIAPGGGGTGGGGGGSEETPQQVLAAEKNYFWYYLAAGALTYYLLKNSKK